MRWGGIGWGGIGRFLVILMSIEQGALTISPKQSQAIPTPPDPRPQIGPELLMALSGRHSAGGGGSGSLQRGGKSKEEKVCEAEQNSRQEHVRSIEHVLVLIELGLAGLVVGGGVGGGWRG